MTEAYWRRAIRIVGAGVDGALGAVERRSGEGLMRQSIRDLDGVIHDLLRQRERAEQHAAVADAQGRAADARVEALREQARFALTKDRTDLAERAVTEQLAAEKAGVQARADVEDAARRRSALDAQIADVRARRRRLDEAYRADRDVAADVAAERAPPVVENRVRRAEAAFARHLAGRDAVDAGRPVEAIDALARDDAVATRLAALRDELAMPPAPAKGRGRRR